MTVTLTEKERFVILFALRIASEDGSIYGGDDHNESTERLIESIREKLKK